MADIKQNDVNNSAFLFRILKPTFSIKTFGITSTAEQCAYICLYVQISHEHIFCHETHSSDLHLQQDTQLHQTSTVSPHEGTKEQYKMERVTKTMPQLRPNSTELSAE